MNEVRALVEAFDAAIERGERCALATIVNVEGSSYRRPGARMLVRESGATTGTISAGCLENDVVEHAKAIILTGKAKLVEYDNASTSDEMAWGLGLGCNGIVRVLVEPLGVRSLYLEALKRSLDEGADGAHDAVATVYGYTHSETGAEEIAIGSRLFIVDGEAGGRDTFSAQAAAILEREVRSAISSGITSGVLSVDVNGAVAKVFVEALLPPTRLVIFGAGHDAVPIVDLARGLGWQTEVVDPQARLASRERFAAADKVILARAGDVRSIVRITSRTMTLLMSHNYTDDLALLKFLLASSARYIGVMGPRKRTQRMLSELDASLLKESNLMRVHSPVGLDIGGNGPAEIALSIIAEMRAVLNGRSGGLLRDSRGPIRGAGSNSESSPSSNEPSTKGNSTDRVGAVILAAGASSRMGKPKQTLQFEGESLLRRAALSALRAGCSPVIVVTGANAELCEREVEGLDVHAVLNPTWESGMGSSVSAGVRGLLRADSHAAATVILVCDQPHVNVDVVSSLVTAHRVTGKVVVGSRYGRSIGVPALFGRSLFEELLQLEGAAGAKSVIIRNESDAHFITFPDGEVDVDTPDDYLQLIARAGEINGEAVSRRSDVEKASAWPANA